jgi:ribonuclease G
LGILGRLARDRLNQDVEAVLIDSHEEFQAFRDLVIALAPQFAQRVEYYDEPLPIFHKFRLDDDIEQAVQHIVPLPHGGSLTIDETEALTAIDVNTAKFVGKSRLAETVLQTNLEAVEEAARQIRLRDLGGVIVIDFIDTGRTRDRIQVMDALEAALKLDRTRTRIVQLSPSGLVEMTRRREGQSLRQMLHRPCPYCSGDGVVKNELSVGIDARRQVRAVAWRTPGAAVKVTLHPETAPTFLGPDDDFLTALEKACGVKVFLRVDFNLHLEATHIDTGKVEEFETSGALSPGAHLHLLPHTRFYPEDAPQFTVLEGMLVRLNKPLEIHRKPGQPPQKPSVLEVTEVSRWFIAARVLTYGDPVNT